MFWRALIILFLIPQLASSQNLISNGSFEVLDTCDFQYSIGNIRYVQSWHSTYYNQTGNPNVWHGSSDFFTNTCSNTYDFIPINVFGNQDVRFKQNYAGMYFISPSVATGRREGIQNELKTDLDSGVEYCFQAYVSLADSIDFSRAATKQFDILVTDTMYSVPYYSVDTSVEPTIRITEPSYFKDKMNWMKVQGSFVAQGSEKWLSISNFEHSDSLDLIYFSVNQQINICYYYIDDVSLYPCDTEVFEANAGADQSGCSGDSVYFSTPYRNEEYSYFWIDEYDDTLSTSTILAVEVQEDAEYYLAQWDFKYDLTWDTVRVIRDYCPELELPNVFTPNGDSNNELWKPSGADLDQVEIAIYNRWGKEVFSYSGDFNSFQGWNGDSAPEGTYYVVLRATVLNNRIIDQNSTLTLLR